jgi:hypothetical protein
MQIFPPQRIHYLPLLVLLPLALATASPSHLALLTFLMLLRPTTTQNYCNAAVSLLLTPLLLLLNLHDASRIIYEYMPFYPATQPAICSGCKVSSS